MILINPILAKSLEPEDYAIIGYYNSFSVIFLCLINISLTFYYGPYYLKTTDENRQELTDTVVTALTVFGFVCAILVTFLFYLYHITKNINFDFLPYALLTISTIFFQNFYTIYQIQARINKFTVRYAFVSISQSIIGALLAIFFVYLLDLGAFGRLTAALITYIFIGLFCFYKLIGKFKINFIILKDLIKYSWPLSVSGILWFFFTGVDTILLEKLNNKVEFGFYSVALAISGYMTFFYTAISNTYEPDIFESINKKEYKKLRNIVFLILTLNLIPNVIFIIWSDEIIWILTSGRYTESSDYAKIFALKNISLSFYSVLITLYAGFGLTKYDMFLRFAGAIICFFIFKILINYYGFYGAAWGQVISFLILSIIAFGLLTQKIKNRRCLQIYE